MIDIIETNDFALLAEMNEEVQTLHHHIQPNIFKPYDKESIRGFFRTTLEKENTTAFIARENGTVLGYILLFLIEFAENPFQYSRNYLLIDQILVVAEHQGKGAGKMLMNAAYEFAQSKNIKLLELNHWTANNKARDFFNKSGFEYYNEKMWKTID